MCALSANGRDASTDQGARDCLPAGPRMTVNAADISAVMREMGKRGGKIGGKRCLETMTAEQRSVRAARAARARWGTPIAAVIVGSWWLWKWPDGLQVKGMITKVTPARIYFMWPKYQDSPHSRRCRRDEFLARIKQGVILSISKDAGGGGERGRG